MNKIQFFLTLQEIVSLNLNLKIVLRFDLRLKNLTRIFIFGFFEPFFLTPQKTYQ